MNYFALNFLGTSHVYGILDLLIKNKLIFVHRRVLACFLDTLLRLNAKFVPTS